MATRTIARPIPIHRSRRRTSDGGVELLARWMDSAFTVPGTNIRFGLDSLIGLLPGAGDTITSLVSLYILSAAHRKGASKATLLRMGFNVAVDLVVGAIPLLGDLFDVYFKSNQRNVALLQRHLAATPVESRRLERGDRWFVWAIMAVLILVLGACLYAAVQLATWIGGQLFG